MRFWDEIGDYVESKGHRREHFDALLTFIEAADSPIELPRILSNLLQLIVHLNKLNYLYTEFDIEITPVEWSLICKEILNYPRLKEIVPVTREKARKPLRGNYKRHQVYVAIWQRPDSPEDHQRYFQLLAHSLLSIAVLRERMDEQISHGISKLKIKDYKSNIKDVLCTVRSLALFENLSILESLPDLNVSPEKAFTILASKNDLFTPFRVLSTYLYELKIPPSKRKHPVSPRLGLPATRTEIRSNLDTEQDEAETDVDLFLSPSMSDADAREWENAGCSPNETYSGAEIVSPRMVKGKEKQVKTPRQKVFRLRRLKTRLSMQNQRLTNRWEVLSLYEVSTLFSAIADIIKHKNQSPYLPPKIIPWELATVILTMFWYGKRLEYSQQQDNGRGLEPLDKLRIYRHSPGVNDSVQGFVLQDDKDVWWTRPALPVRMKELDDYQKRQAHDSDVTNFSIYSGQGHEKFIRIYVDKVTPDPNSEFLFPRKLKIYEQMITEFLTRVNRRRATRLTINRISDYLFEMIASHDGSDLTAAMFIIGRDNFLGRNLSYYSGWSVERLQEIYREVCAEISKRMRREIDKSPDVQIIQENTLNSDKYIGSPYRPFRKTVQSLVEELKKNLEEATSADRSVLKLMRLHNSMTRYTAFMISFCTGFRAVRDPFFSAAEIDWVTGFCTLSDKDNEDRYNSRLIWLPPVCIKQLKLFQEHQQNALYRFNALIPNFYNKLDSPRRDGLGRRMYFAKEDINREEYVAITIGPKLLGTKLRSIFALPFNAGRHYLRSELLERKCPIEVINALLGHFERGEEPFGIYSGLSPLVFRDILIDKLLPLLEEDGWKELPGLGTKL